MSEHEIQTAIQTAVEIITKPYQKTTNMYFSILIGVMLVPTILVGIDIGNWKEWRLSTDKILDRHETAIESLQMTKNSIEMKKINSIK